MRIVFWIVGVMVVLCAGLGLAGYLVVRTVGTVPVTTDLWMLTGLGGNVAVLRTAEGAVVVDSMSFPLQGQRILDRAQQLTGQPVVLLINTHYHADHTHGNPAFDGSLRIVATQRTLRHLQVIDPTLLNKPNDTFQDQRIIKIGGQSIRLLSPGRGHTDGDLVVLFENQRVLHTGDLFFNRLYPSIDLEGGGSAIAWDGTLDRVLALDFDAVIPGHGNLGNRADLAQFQQLMRQLVQIGAKSATVEQAQASADLTADVGYKPLQLAGFLPVGLDRNFALQRAWEEAHQAFERRSLK